MYISTLMSVSKLFLWCFLFFTSASLLERFHKEGATREVFVYMTFKFVWSKLKYMFLVNLVFLLILPQLLCCLLSFRSCIYIA